MNFDDPVMTVLVASLAILGVLGTVRTIQLGEQREVIAGWVTFTVAWTFLAVGVSGTLGDRPVAPLLIVWFVGTIIGSYYAFLFPVKSKLLGILSGTS